MMLLRPNYLLRVPTAWDDNEFIIADIMHRFKVKHNCFLEFGVDYGFSLSAFANYFNLAVGVDTFKGDVHAGQREVGLFESTVKLFEGYSNVILIECSYQDYIGWSHGRTRYDMIHIDIVHDYKETNECGAWAIEHSDVVLFHDTIAFPEVRRAVQDLAWESGRTFYEYQVKHGLGMLVKE
jgi:hypothetical protein